MHAFVAVVIVVTKARNKTSILFIHKQRWKIKLLTFKLMTTLTLINLCIQQN